MEEIHNNSPFYLQFEKTNLRLDIILNLHYVPSKENLADEPSRQLNKSDATLHTGIWHKIQEQFGGSTGNTIDLMSVDSNTMKDCSFKVELSIRDFDPSLFQAPIKA
jgi:hypothetical protein